ncbi:MAG: carotenoid oxygenase family protein [Gammaproteobacteria bacterium]|nr:carotenoid oxygenase family protein [Gammaproteobacteria bacterium]
MSRSRRYLDGLFAPLTEELTSHELDVAGRIPAGLDGRYLRTGANPRPDIDPERHHLLAATAMVHGTELGGGRVLSHRNRWITPPPVPPRLTRDLLVPAADGCAGLFTHAGDVFASAEMGVPCRLSPQLETLDLADFGAPLPTGAAPHPRHDPRSGELHLLAYHFEAPYLRHHRIDARGQLIESRDLPLPQPGMVHDFALTAQHLVIFDLPVRFNEDALLDGQPLPYRWEERGAARIGLLPRQGPSTTTRWFAIDPCWVSHVAGAFEVGDRVVVDLIRKPSRFRHDLRGDDDGPGELLRCTLDPRFDFALVEVLDADPQDLPVVDPRLPNSERRWLWTTAQEPDDHGHLPAGRELYRHDLGRGQRATIALPEDFCAGAMTFVPAHPSAPEGKGWLLGYLSHRSDEFGEMIILDATRPEAEPVARIRLPQRMPLGSHGCWLGRP